MVIRDERSEDASRIALIHYAAFKNHPVHPPGAEPVEHLIVDGLRADGALTLSLLAETGGQAAGHIALSPATVGAARHGWHLLGPVGVLPGQQGRGIGSALIRAALERLRAMDALGVVLVGEPGYYVRFGFASVPGLAYPGVPDQYVLALAFGPARPQGAITAHKAFGAPQA